MRVVLTTAVRLLVAVALICLITPLSTHPAESLWSPFAGGVEGTRVDAMIEFNGDLIIGGQFTKAGGVEVHNAARWDGSQWHAIGAPFWNSISKMIVFRGTLYATGSTPLNPGDLASWNGMEWSRSPGWLEASQGWVDGVHDWIIWRNTLVVASRRLSFYDGHQWSNVDSTQVRMYNSWLLSEYENNLVCTGDFYLRSQGSDTYHIAVRFDGTSWSPLDKSTELDFWPSEIATINNKLMALSNGYHSSAPIQAYEWQDSAWVRSADVRYGLPGTTTRPLHSLRATDLGSYRFSWELKESDTFTWELGYVRQPSFWNDSMWYTDIPGARCFLVKQDTLIAGLLGSDSISSVLGFRLSPDADGDQVYDAEDNCPCIQNPNQSDIDGDSFGDLCDQCSPCGPVVYVDHIEGSQNLDTLSVETPVTIYIGISGFEANPTEALTIALRLYSPDNANWEVPVVDTSAIDWLDQTYGFNNCFFGFAENETHGMGSDTIGFHAKSDGAGLPPRFASRALKISTSFHSTMSGKTICIDTSSIRFDHPNQGCDTICTSCSTALWSNEIGLVRPYWNGPYCYSIWNCAHGMSGNTDCDDRDLVDIGDLTRLIDYLYLSQQPLCCPLEANTDGLFAIDIGDLTMLIDHLYVSFRPLAPTP